MENRPEFPAMKVPQPIRKDGAGATDYGPRDVWRDLENPDMLVPPETDAGTVPNLKFSFSDTHMQLNHGGWSRQVTVRELPIATTLAGVNMRLTPGGVRELHWHKQAEWAFMILGRARITAVDQNGRNFIADVGVGDLWYFPPGIPHSIQGLEEGCEFLIITPGGTVRIVDSTNFPVSTRIAAALVEIKPGGMRELHWHPNNDEWQYYLTGMGRMTVFAANGTARTFNYRAGDVGYVPFAFGHYIQNIGSESLWFLEIFKSNRFEDVSLNQWMALTPRQLVQDNLNVGPELMNALRKEKWPVVKYLGL